MNTLYLRTSLINTVNEMVPWLLLLHVTLCFFRYFLPVMFATMWPSMFSRGQYWHLLLVHVVLTRWVGSLTSVIGVSFDLTGKSCRFLGLR